MIADDVLMLANLRAYSDPDPDRAFRYRPFVYGSASGAARALEARPPAPVRRFVALRAALAAVPRIAPIARSASASPCPACC